MWALSALSKNMKLKYQLPSGEWHSLELSNQEIIEALVEKGVDGMLPMLVTTLEITNQSSCKKNVKTTLLNAEGFEALTEIE